MILSVSRTLWSVISTPMPICLRWRTIRWMSSTAIVGSEEITNLPMYLRARKGISYLPQEPSIFRKLSVEDNLRAVFETLDLRPNEQEQRADQLIRQFGRPTTM